MAIIDSYLEFDVYAFKSKSTEEIDHFLEELRQIKLKVTDIKSEYDISLFKVKTDKLKKFLTQIFDETTNQF